MISRIVRLLSIVVVVLSVLSGGNSVVQAVPYQSYIYSIWGTPVPAPQAYVPARQLRANDMGLTGLNAPQDMFITSDNQVFIVDSGNHRVIWLNEEFRVVNIIDQFKMNGVVERFNNPQGIFVTDQGEVYVADRDNGRVVVVTPDGEFVKIIGAPEPDVEGVLPEDFRYRPLKLVVDKANRLYVIADNVFEGFIEFTVDGSFRGFMGAPRVAPSAADVFWSRFATQEQRARQALFLPTQYSNADLDPRGFIFATIASGAIGIRRLNLSGTDVTRRLGFVPPIGDSGRGLQRSTLVDVNAGQDGIFRLLDRRRGRIFTYDENGNLLYVFGGRGDQLGTFRNPVALSNLGDQLVVLDSSTNMVTVFNPTQYALDIHAAIHHYFQGQYTESTEMWQKVLQQNVNYDLAYSGVGRALLRQRHYPEAMYYLRLGQDRRAYSDAWWRYRRELIGDHFGKLMTGLLVAVFAIYLLSKYKQRGAFRRKFEDQQAAGAAPVPTQQGFLVNTMRALAYSTHVIFHPYDGFWDLKHEKRGNGVSASILLLLVTATYIFMRQYTGFLFNYRDLTRLNIFVEMVSIMIPVSLWVIVNWALTTLMEGKGTRKDIFIATAYALTPIILINVPMTVISNYLTIQEGTLYYSMITLGSTWSFALLFLGTMITHEYDMVKTFFTSVLILCGMVIVLFIALLFFTVIDQVMGFVTDIYSELVFRL